MMGSGEPMDNYDNLVRFIRLLSDENGLNISQRNITVSTCGIEKGLRELGESGLAYLAVSLHAPTQELRARIMPKAARWPLEDLLQALKSYPLKTRERITFEYLLLGGVNDGLEQARQLGVRFVACEMAMNVMGITREELVEVDEVAGVASFVGMAKESNNTLFI